MSSGRARALTGARSDNLGDICGHAPATYGSAHRLYTTTVTLTNVRHSRANNCKISTSKRSVHLYGSTSERLRLTGSVGTPNQPECCAVSANTFQSETNWKRESTRMVKEFNQAALQGCYVCYILREQVSKEYCSVGAEPSLEVYSIARREVK